jgi:HlyD family secretion protein
MAKKYFSYIKRPPVFILLLILIFAVGGYIWYAQKGGAEYEVAEAKRMTLRQEVSVTGRVEPIESVDLSFERGGRIRSVSVKVGDQVLLGMTLMSLENGDLVASRDQAEADLKANQATLEEYKRGTRMEELAISEAKVRSADSLRIDATSNLIDKISDSYTKSDDAIRNKVDQFIINPRGSNPQLSFSIPDSKLKNSIETERLTLEGVLASWNISLSSVEADILGALGDAKERAVRIRSFLDTVAAALSTLTPSSSLTQATIDGYRADVSTARTNINTALTNLTAGEEKLRTAESSLFVAKREFDLAKAGKSPQEIATQEARVLQAQAKVRSADAEIIKTLIRAPISGIVTEKNANPGETVSANAIMVKLLSASGFKVESFVPEVDIAKINEGDTALITLDAYGSETIFSARVSRIDPRETILDGVATYKVTFDFAQRDERIRAGMTANIDIVAQEKPDALAIPQRAVKTKDGKKYVDVLNADGKTTTSMEVKTGLKGSDGNIEILSGLEVGQRIVVFSKTE